MDKEIKLCEGMCMKRIVNQLIKVVEEVMMNVARQQSLVDVHTHTHTCNFIEKIRVVDDCSIYSGRNRLLLDRSRQGVSGKGLFCVYERKIFHYIL